MFLSCSLFIKVHALLSGSRVQIKKIKETEKKPRVLMTKMPLMGPAHNKYISPGVVCEPQSSLDGSYEFSSNL